MLKFKQLYTAIAILSAIVFYFFFTYTQDLHRQFDVTNKELTGLIKLKMLDNITDVLEQYRGIQSLEYGSPSDKNYAKKRKLELREKILTLLPILENTKSAEKIRTILTKQSSDPIKTFNDLTALISTLNTMVYDFADRYYLLYEPEKNNYLLMNTLVNILPDLQENAAKLRGIATRAHTEINISNDEIMLNYTRHHFEQNMHTLHSSTLLMPENDPLLQNSITTIERTYQNYNQLLDEMSSHQALKYFYDGTRVIESIDAYFNIAQHKLKINLEKRAQSLRNTIIINYSAFFFTVFSTIILTAYIYRREKELHERKNKEITDQTLLERLQSNILASNHLKGTCDESLRFVANYFEAVTGVFYLYNPTNNQLDLSATYGINDMLLTHTLEIGEGSIGQNFLEKRVIELQVEEDKQEYAVDIGTIRAKIKKVITFPLEHFDKTIGIFQIVLTKNTTVDYEFLNKYSAIIATLVEKAIQQEESKKYLEGIDKNVITSSTNAQGFITMVSEAFASISGYSKEELLGKRHNIIRHPDMPNELFEDLWSTITKGIEWKGEVKNRTKTGGFYWVDVIITPNFSLYGKILGYTAIRHDITNKKKIEEIAITDGLTQIFNRRHFDSAFPLKLKEARRDNKNLVFILLDIDHFKQFNDTYGHQEGDYALISVANTLKTILKRPGDFVFRLGGEEFGLIFNAKSAEEAEIFAVHIKNSIESLNIQHSRNSASEYVTISMGLIFILPETTQTADHLYKIADEMLYEAKESGRNNVRMKIIE